MIKKILTIVLALSVFSVSASILPAKAELESFKSVEQLAKQLSDEYTEKDLDAIRQELAKSGMNIKALEESISNLNIDPTLTNDELVATLTDFTRSQLETGATYNNNNNIHEITKWAAVTFFLIGSFARLGPDADVRAKGYMGIGIMLGLISAVCNETCYLEGEE